MNSEIEKLKSTLKKLILLFKEYELENWANAYTDILLHLEDDPEYIKYQLRISFGRMGSINDLVLSRNGIPLINENNYLNKLRSELYAHLT